MATFNSIADEIAGALDRPFDDMFKQRIKEVFRHELARMLRQSMDKTGVDVSLVQRYTAVLEEVDSGDTVVSYDCTILRTEDKIYKPIRWKTVEPFTYIGSDDIPFIYRHSVEAKRLAPFLSLTGNAISYDYRNGYIYIYNGKRLEYVTIETVFANPADILAVETADAIGIGESTCKDDMVIPIAEDLIQTVKDKLFSGELAIIDDKDKVKPAHIDNN